MSQQMDQISAAASTDQVIVQLPSCLLLQCEVPVQATKANYCISEVLKCPKCILLRICRATRQLINMDELCLYHLHQKIQK